MVATAIRPDRDGAQRCMTAVHATPHVAAEWAGFQRLRPNNIAFESMQKLAENDFAPSSTRLSPALLGGYKNSWETALYLSEKVTSSTPGRYKPSPSFSRMPLPVHKS